jgi:hypothetical protein
MSLEVTFGTEPKPRYTLELDTDATEQQKTNLEAWLGEAS